MSKVKKDKVKKPVKQSYFQLAWLNNYDWLKKGDDPTKFGCKRCCKTDLKLANMGIGALGSHIKSKTHMKAEAVNQSVKNFFTKHTPSSTSSSPSTSLPSSQNESPLSTAASASTASSTTASSSTASSSTASSSGSVDVVEIDVEPEPKALQTTIQHGIYTSQVFDAEILWCLRTILKDNSNRSNDNIADTFKKMFPDSRVAASFACGKDKTQYLVNHGVCPWIKQLLETEVTKATYVVMGFDESLNKMTQTCQMDFNVRFWDPVANLVKVRYWDSKFLGHTANTDLLDTFNAATTNINASKIIQVSMDGPSVNHLFYWLITEPMRSKSNRRWCQSDRVGCI